MVLRTFLCTTSYRCMFYFEITMVSFFVLPNEIKMALCVSSASQFPQPMDVKKHLA